MTVAYSKCTVCGTKRTREQWRQLPLVGIWTLEEDGARKVIESRNCGPATLSVELCRIERTVVAVASSDGLTAADVLSDAILDLQAELSKVRDLHRRILLTGVRKALEARPAPPEPHLGQIGRDPPGYAYLARKILERSTGEGLEDDLRAELRAAYQDGANRVREERAAAALGEAERREATLLADRPSAPREFYVARTDPTLIGVFSTPERAKEELARFCLEEYGKAEIPSWCSVERATLDEVCDPFEDSVDLAKLGLKGGGA